MLIALLILILSNSIKENIVTVQFTVARQSPAPCAGKVAVTG